MTLARVEVIGMGGVNGGGNSTKTAQWRVGVEEAPGRSGLTAGESAERKARRSGPRPLSAPAGGARFDSGGPAFVDAGLVLAAYESARAAGRLRRGVRQ